MECFNIVVKLAVICEDRANVFGSLITRLNCSEFQRTKIWLLDLTVPLLDQPTFVPCSSFPLGQSRGSRGRRLLISCSTVSALCSPRNPVPTRRSWERRAVAGSPGSLVSAGVISARSLSAGPGVSLFLPSPLSLFLSFSLYRASSCPAKELRGGVTLLPVIR